VLLPCTGRPSPPHRPAAVTCSSNSRSAPPQRTAAAHRPAPSSQPIRRCRCRRCCRRGRADAAMSSLLLFARFASDEVGAATRKTQHHSTTAPQHTPKHTITPRWSDHHPRMVGSSPPDGRIIAPGWSDHTIPMVVWYHPDGRIIPSRWWFGTIPMVVWYHPLHICPVFCKSPVPFPMVVWYHPDGVLVPSRWWFGTIPMVVWYHPDGLFLRSSCLFFLMVWSGCSFKPPFFKPRKKKKRKNLEKSQIKESIIRNAPN